MRQVKKEQFSVLLLYPDYLSDGKETYYAFVRATNAGMAVIAAQHEASKANSDTVPDDFLPLLVTCGHNKDWRF